MDFKGEVPDLNFVKPDTKRALEGKETIPFEQSCQSSDDDWAEDLDVVRALGSNVAYIDGLLTEKECKQLCRLVDESNELSFWSEAGRENEHARSFRDADTIEVKSVALADKLWNRVKRILGKDEDIICIEADDQDNPQWERELPGVWVPSSFNGDLLFAKYPCGGSFAPHTDGRAIHTFNKRSFKSVIIFLNDIPSDCGGGTRFYSQEALRDLELVSKSGPEIEDGASGDPGASRWSAKSEYITLEVSPRAGRLLIFDQSLVHEGVPPKDPHLKYIIRSDVMYTRRVPVFDSAVDTQAYALFRKAETVAEDGNVEESVRLFRRAIKMSPAMAEMMGH